MNIKIVFSEYFEIQEKDIDDYGALNISLGSDLPLFIDPFLLFSSEKPEYQELHKKIVNHLILLKEIALDEGVPVNYSIFKFPEIKQNWLGLCEYGNNGKGLGNKFAKSVVESFNGFYRDFGNEELTDSTHIEKLTLVGSGVGKDFISDFTANLMLEYLLNYTQEFAKKYLREDQRKVFNIRCIFDEKLKVWVPKKFELPYFYLEEDGDFIILTPCDILTKDDSFISKQDFHRNFKNIALSIGDRALRDSINSYFYKSLPPKAKRKDFDAAIVKTINEFPEIVDHYIGMKEKDKDRSKAISKDKIDAIREELISPLLNLCSIVSKSSSFFDVFPDSYREALVRANYLKSVIEDNDGYRIFYHKGKPIAAEETIQRIFKLTWYASPYDVNAEVNNGRGPADYKVSFGSGNATIVEFKLAKSSSLRNNLKHQVEIYKKASKAISDIKVILCYNKLEVAKVEKILKSMGQLDAENIVIIDASIKTSASKVA